MRMGGARMIRTVRSEKKGNQILAFYDRPIVGKDVPGRGFAVFDTLIVES